MSNVTRIRRIAAAAIATLGLIAFAPTASAETTSPDVHAVGFESFCGNKVSVYEVRLRNFGDQRRGVRARIAWRGHGWSETYSRQIASGRTVTETVRLDYGEQAVLTLRSQEQVIARVHMYGTCQRLAH